MTQDNQVHDEHFKGSCPFSYFGAANTQENALMASKQFKLADPREFKLHKEVEIP
jgi:hypothetical protein